MKKVIFILFIIVPVFIFAQQVENDILYTINREQIPCTIQEISDSEIKYIRADKSATILYSTKKENVYCIIFKDGSVEYFSDKLRQPAEKTVSYAQSNAKPEITQNIVGTHVKQAQTTQQTQQTQPVQQYSQPQQTQQTQPVQQYQQPQQVQQTQPVQQYQQPQQMQQTQPVQQYSQPQQMQQTQPVQQYSQPQQMQQTQPVQQYSQPQQTQQTPPVQQYSQPQQMQQTQPVQQYQQPQQVQEYQPSYYPQQNIHNEDLNVVENATYRIYRENGEFMYKDTYISEKEVMRILQATNFEAYRKYKYGNNLLIGSEIVAGIGCGLMLGSLFYITADINAFIGLIVSGVAITGITFPIMYVCGLSQKSKALDIYNSRFDRNKVALNLIGNEKGIGFAITF